MLEGSGASSSDTSNKEGIKESLLRSFLIFLNKKEKVTHETEEICGPL